MVGQGTTRPGLTDSTPDRWSLCRALDKMIDDQRALGNACVDIYMSRTKRRELLREINQGELLFPLAPEHCGMQVITEYAGCPVNLIANDAETSIYVVARRD